jgi:aromatic ring-opening dioxygenase LigB subunit
MRASVHYDGEVVQNINNPKSSDIVDATDTVVERAGEGEEE